MSDLLIGIIGIAVLLLLFLLEMPIAFSMALVGFVGFCILTSFHAGLNILARDVYTQFSNYSLTPLVTFILMGNYAFATGITSRLYDASYKWVGQYRGGLAISSILACSGFAAICGSMSATAATVGRVAMPEMRKRGYSDTLAAGCIAAGGTLGIMIPPSNAFILYGILTEQSIGSLFIAGILPGLVLAGLFIVVIVIICQRDPQAGPSGPHTSWIVKFKSLAALIEVLVLFGLVIGGLFAGWFTPTLGGGIGAAGALLIGLGRRELSWSKFFQVTKEGVMTACMIVFIVAGSAVFGHFIAASTLPIAFANLAGEFGLPPVVTMIFIVIIYLIAGCFIDVLPMILLTIPTFYPIVVNLGYNPIWFGVITVLVSEAGVLTPPVGVVAYVVHGINREISLQTVFKGIVPFLVALILMIVLVFIWPQLTTFLPSFIRY